MLYDPDVRHPIVLNCQDVLLLCKVRAMFYLSDFDYFSFPIYLPSK
jgi:hypothetical protein